MSEKSAFSVLMTGAILTLMIMPACAANVHSYLLFDDRLSVLHDDGTVTMYEAKPIKSSYNGGHIVCYHFIKRS